MSNRKLDEILHDNKEELNQSYPMDCHPRDLLIMKQRFREDQDLLVDCCTNYLQ